MTELPVHDPADGAVDTVRRCIEHSRPAAVAGWAEYWARLCDLPLDRTIAALACLVSTGEVRVVMLEGRSLYVADAPHATQ